ncbi:MAG: DUF308 domain-containing protein [Corynebacterium sp.]|nr:DUF308 domain-containing protein [Corynebacterium sp.]
MFESVLRRSSSHLLLTGIAAALTGFFAIVWPGATMVVLALIWGIYALSDGIMQVYAGFQLPNHRGLLIFSGVLGIIFGLIVIFNPDIGVVVIAWMLGLWMLLRGIEEFAAVFKGKGETTDKILYAFVGVLFVAASIIFFAAPGLSAAVVALWLGFFALFTGVLLIVLSFRVRKTSKNIAELRAEHPRVR